MSVGIAFEVGPMLGSTVWIVLLFSWNFGVPELPGGFLPMKPILPGWLPFGPCWFMLVTLGIRGGLHFLILEVAERFEEKQKKRQQRAAAKNKSSSKSNGKGGDEIEMVVKADSTQEKAMKSDADVAVVARNSRGESNRKRR